MTDNSSFDDRVKALTGFEPAPRSMRCCVSCGQAGHYYYECNGGAFLNAVDGLVEGLKAIHRPDDSAGGSHG